MDYTTKRAGAMYWVSNDAMFSFYNQASNMKMLSLDE